MTIGHLDIIGWCEWAVFPELGHERVNMKVDTGAKTSCLHAAKIEPFTKQDKAWVRVWFQPEQGSSREVVREFRVHDCRKVKNSGGMSTERYVIKTPVIIGQHQFEIELTLANRDNMNFRMLLGRRALAERFLVNASASYLLGE